MFGVNLTTQKDDKLNCFHAGTFFLFRIKISSAIKKFNVENDGRR